MQLQIFFFFFLSTCSLFAGIEAAISAKKVLEPQNEVKEGSPGKGSPVKGDASLGKKELTGIAGIEDYFKSCPNKGTEHRMKNIDFIYMINLDQRPEKYASCIKQLDPYGIKPYRFSAVNGWELSLDVLNELGIKYEHWMDSSMKGTSYLLESDGNPFHDNIHVVGRTYFSHCMARGPIGIVLSHLSILQDAVDSGYNTIWVMEDDIKIIRNPLRISKLIEKLDKLVGSSGWDILFTDKDTKNNKGEYVSCISYAKRPNFKPEDPERFAIRKEISKDFRQLGARFGAYSMIVRRSGMIKILDFIKTHKIFLPYDMEFYLPSGIKIFALNKDRVGTQQNALSDNRAPRYKEKEV